MEAYEAFNHLGRRFASAGRAVRISREGLAIRWTCGLASAIVEPSGDGTVAARFVGAPEPEAVGGREARPAYRGARAYPLTALGCSRMADDLAAFFAGEREPRFTFVGAE